MKRHWNRRRKVVLYTVLMALVVLAAFAYGALIPESAAAPDFSQAKLPPSLAHPFGTDWLGRDLFLRTLKGLSVSLTVGVAASLISAVAAVLIGIAAATGSRAVDGVITWIIDLVMGVPHTVLVILISFACGRGLKGLGTDAISIDRMGDSKLPIHHILLKDSILSIENLCLKKVRGRKDFLFFALPMKFQNTDGAPIRAFAELREAFEGERRRR